jgi:hypothetical protein
MSIYDFTHPFSFDALELGAPVKKGTGYTIRFSIDENPIYLQPPKCFLKSGFTKSTGKTAYCDLLFGMENEKFLSWAEQMERSVIGRIYERRTEWFDVDDPDVSLDDIQSYVQPIGKPYKSGRMYLVRATLSPAELRVWDEQEHAVEHDDLCENMRVVTILELKQLNCSATSFQFVFELKQMMLSPERTTNFDRCLIKSHEVKSHEVKEIKTQAKVNPESSDSLKIKEDVRDYLGKHEDSSSGENTHNRNTALIETRTKIEAEKEKEKKEPVKANKKPAVEEVEFDLAELDGVETIHLTDPNEVYFKMYKEARRKMKEAKIIALSNYLEAKRIKTTYLADLQDDDDDDSGDEQHGSPKDIDNDI